MGLNIISDKDNALLGRKEIIAKVDFSGATPSKSELKKMIVSKTGCDEKLTVIKIIKNEFGKQKAGLTAYIYKTIDDMKKLEKIEEPKEKKKEKNSEKPAETKSEDIKPEKKPADDKPAKEESKQKDKPAEKGKKDEKPADKKAENLEEKKGE